MGINSRKYQVTLTGRTDTLVHADNIEWRDQMEAWRNDPENKKLSKPGDDRTPAFTWLGYLYHDNNVVGWHSDCLMTMIRDAATMITVKGQKTFKSQSQSGIMVNEILWPIRVKGKEIPWGPLKALERNMDFEEHKRVVGDLGFELFVKTVVIQGRKNIRVRPRFSNWTVQGTVTVFDEMITAKILQDIFDLAGVYVGLSNWRPRSPRSPGRFGLFGAIVEEIG